MANVTTQVLDGELLDVPAESFNAVISRVGFIYFPDQQAAFAGMLRALRPGGKLAGDRLLDRREQRVLLDPGVGHPPPRASCHHHCPASRAVQPRRSWRGRGGAPAGWVRRRHSHRRSRRRCGWPSSADCVRFERESFGALHQMLAKLDVAGRDAAWTRSRSGWPSSTARTGSSVRASCSSSRGRGRSDRHGRCGSGSGRPGVARPRRDARQARRAHREGRGDGAGLVVFPETFLPGYPDWVWRCTPWDATSDALFGRMQDQAVVVGSQTTDLLGETAARAARAWLCVGRRRARPARRARCTTRCCTSRRTARWPARIAS